MEIVRFAGWLPRNTSGAPEAAGRISIVARSSALLGRFK
jgi:hypothetical protein